MQSYITANLPGPTPQYRKLDFIGADRPLFSVEKGFSQNLSNSKEECY